MTILDTIVTSSDILRLRISRREKEGKVESSLPYVTARRLGALWAAKEASFDKLLQVEQTRKAAIRKVNERCSGFPPDRQHLAEQRHQQIILETTHEILAIVFGPSFLPEDGSKIDVEKRQGALVSKFGFKEIYENRAILGGFMEGCKDVYDLV